MANPSLIVEAFSETRNKTVIEPILLDFLNKMKRPASVLELGCGNGIHALYYCSRYQENIGKWVMTDVPRALPGVQRFMDAANYEEMKVLTKSIFLPPLPLNFSDGEEKWRSVAEQGLTSTTEAKVGTRGQFDVVFTANTFHVASAAEIQTLFSRIPLVLCIGGVFLVYGPFNRGGKYTSPSNAQFDVHVKKVFGPLAAIQHIEVLTKWANESGIELLAEHEVPENNFVLVFRRLK